MLKINISPIKFENATISKKDLGKGKAIISYTKLSQQIDFQQMYQQFDKDMAQIVGSQRIKLAAMNPKQSQDIVNKTQNKLLLFLKQKSGTNKYFNNRSLNKNMKSNQIQKIIQKKQSTQQIFDFNKLQCILKSYERPYSQKRKIKKGVLYDQLQKQLDKTMNKSMDKIRTHTQNPTQTKRLSRNYLSWTAQKGKRSARNMFNWR